MNFEIIWAVLLPIIAIIVVFWGITRAMYFWQDLPMKHIRQIAQRNNKEEPYNWLFVAGWLSWPTVLLYWLFNEKNKSFSQISGFLRSKKFLIGLGIIVIAFGWFYWFQWRPAQIRKDCAQQYRSSDLYNNCIRKQGLDQ
jgi:magnesium-transporting ATPase (P-type)